MTEFCSLVHKLTNFGISTARGCSTNERRTCACQGETPETAGMSYFFGCSWSMFYNMCKYARSRGPRKFKLEQEREEPELELHMGNLASAVTPIFYRVAPEAYGIMAQHDNTAKECRVGQSPFAGITACMDFCSHSHKDIHNMDGGCSVVSDFLFLVKVSADSKKKKNTSDSSVDSKVDIDR